MLRLSGHQATLLLSSIWAQAISPKNNPRNYEAIAHTYCLLLLFLGSKVLLFMSCHVFYVYFYLSLQKVSIFLPTFFPVKRMISYSFLSNAIVQYHAQPFSYRLFFTLVFVIIVYNIILHTYTVYCLLIWNSHRSEHYFSLLIICPHFLFQTSIFEALAPSFQIAFSLMSHSLGRTGEDTLLIVCLAVAKLHAGLVV